MSEALYNIYKSDVFKLAETLVLKSEMTAEAINIALFNEGVSVNTYDRSTWKYYKNIAGDYHSTDKPMYVVSMDTLETILFSKENLAIHLATAKEYSYGTRYYNELVGKYPDQFLLINGILNPVDIHKAIAAEDWSILWYDPALVESNEYNLIPEMEAWIKRFMGRWSVIDYRFVEDLYPGALIGTLFLQIPMQIMNIRLANCKTNYAHSYHIREYLASNGKLDVYMDYLTKKQALFLYRNIDFLHRNAGKQETLDLLIQKILTDRGFPIVAYDIAHDNEFMPGEIKPRTVMLQQAKNLTFRYGYSDSYSVSEVIDKERPLARDNPLFGEAAIPLIEEQMSSDRFGILPTKVLDSSVSDAEAFNLRSLEDVLLNEWLYRASHNLFSAVSSFTNPLTGEKTFLQADEAFVVWLYCEVKRFGFTLPYIPTIEAKMVNRPVPPSFADLRKIVTKQFVKDSFIHEARAGLVPVTSIISAESFYDTCKAVYERMRTHYLQYSRIHDFMAHGQCKAVVLHHYADIPCKLFNNQAYPSWFAERSLNFAGFSDYDYGLVATEILDNITGIALNRTTSIVEIHRALVRLMAQLSSYTVQFITTSDNRTDIRVDDAGVMVGNVSTKMAAIFNAEVSTSRVLSMDAKVKALGNGNWQTSSDDLRITTSVKAGMADINVGTNVSVRSRPSYKVNVSIGQSSVLSVKFTSINLSDLFPERYLDGLPIPMNLNNLFEDRFLDGLEVPDDN